MRLGVGGVGCGLEKHHNQCTRLGVGGVGCGLEKHHNQCTLICSNVAKEKTAEQYTMYNIIIN